MLLPRLLLTTILALTSLPSTADTKVLIGDITLQEYLREEFDTQFTKEQRPHLIYEFFTTRDYGHFIIQCFSIQFKDSLRSRDYFILLIQDHQIQWLYPMEGIHLEPENDRYIYKDCSHDEESL